MSREVHDARAVLKDVPAIVIEMTSVFRSQAKRWAARAQCEMNSRGARLGSELPDHIRHLARLTDQGAIDIDTNQRNQRRLPSASTGHECSVASARAGEYRRQIRLTPC